MSTVVAQKKRTTNIFAAAPVRRIKISKEKVDLPAAEVEKVENASPKHNSNLKISSPSKVGRSISFQTPQKTVSEFIQRNCSPQSPRMKLLSPSVSMYGLTRNNSKKGLISPTTSKKQLISRSTMSRCLSNGRTPSKVISHAESTKLNIPLFNMPSKTMSEMPNMGNTKYGIRRTVSEKQLLLKIAQMQKSATHTPQNLEKFITPGEISNIDSEDFQSPLFRSDTDGEAVFSMEAERIEGFNTEHNLSALLHAADDFPLKYSRAEYTKVCRKDFKPSNSNCSTYCDTPLKMPSVIREAPQKLHTWMLRNLPCRFDQNEMMMILNSLGLEGKYNFFYLPIDIKKTAFRPKKSNANNKGYAFINLKDPKDSDFLYSVCHQNKFWEDHWRSNSRKSCLVSPANNQGFFENVMYYKSKVLDEHNSTKAQRDSLSNETNVFSISSPTENEDSSICGVSEPIAVNPLTRFQSQDVSGMLTATPSRTSIARINTDFFGKECVTMQTALSTGVIGAPKMPHEMRNNMNNMHNPNAIIPGNSRKNSNCSIGSVMTPNSVNSNMSLNSTGSSDNLSIFGCANPLGNNRTSDCSTNTNMSSFYPQNNRAVNNSFESSSVSSNTPNLNSSFSPISPLSANNGHTNHGSIMMPNGTLMNLNHMNMNSIANLSNNSNNVIPGLATGANSNSNASLFGSNPLIPGLPGLNSLGMPFADSNALNGFGSFGNMNGLSNPMMDNLMAMGNMNGTSSGSLMNNNNSSFGGNIKSSPFSPVNEHNSFSAAMTPMNLNGSLNLNGQPFNSNMNNNMVHNNYVNGMSHLNQISEQELMKTLSGQVSNNGSAYSKNKPARFGRLSSHISVPSVDMTGKNPNEREKWVEELLAQVAQTPYIWYPKTLFSSMDEFVLWIAGETNLTQHD